MTINQRMALISRGSAYQFKVLETLGAKYKTKMTKKLAIDINTIVGFVFAGKKISIMEILNFYNEKGALLYDGRKGFAPIVTEEGEGLLYDSNTEEGKKFMEKHSIVAE